MAIANAVSETSDPSVERQGDTDARFRRELAFALGLFELLVTSFSCVTELTWGTRALGLLYGAGLMPIDASPSATRRMRAGIPA